MAFILTVGFDVSKNEEKIRKQLDESLKNMSDTQLTNFSKRVSGLSDIINEVATEIINAPPPDSSLPPPDSIPPPPDAALPPPDSIPPPPDSSLPPPDSIPPPPDAALPPPDSIPPPPDSSLPPPDSIPPPPDAALPPPDSIPPPPDAAPPPPPPPASPPKWNMAGTYKPGDRVMWMGLEYEYIGNAGDGNNMPGSSEKRDYTGKVIEPKLWQDVRFPRRETSEEVVSPPPASRGNRGAPRNRGSRGTPRGRRGRGGKRTTYRRSK